MKARDRAPRLVPIAFAMLLAACATVDVTTTQHLGAPQYQPTEPTAVQILRTEPTAPHDRLGEIMVEASTEPAPPITEIEQKVCKAAAKLGADAVVVVYDRIQPVGADLSGPWWGRSVETVSGRKLIAVAIRYKR
jgi:energy-converting hydrogenase Eha subunit F